MNWPASIVVCEVGPRDGLQNEKKLLSVAEKVELIERAAAAGARVIEIGSFVHPPALSSRPANAAILSRDAKVVHIY